jgi:tRNA modification GTPase
VTASRDTATLLTAPGAAAIAVVRIAGPGVATFLSKYFSKPTPPLRCVHGELRDERGEVLDDPVVVVAEDGAFADINLHGGPWVVASTMSFLERGGCAITEQDDHDAAEVIEREMLAALPHAKTEAGVRMLLAQPAAWRELLATPPPRETIEKILADRTLERLIHPARVAIVGPPNVGKSTLANQLFAQERSITADVPGTTRDWVGEIANLDGVPVMLVDTPGVRETADDIERRAIEASREVVRGADVIVYVIDALEPHVPATTTGIIRVLNKVDRGPVPPGLAYDLATVATTGQGIDTLRRLIRTRLGVSDLTPTKPRVWTDRQRTLLSSMGVPPMSG